jgi:hypothetical protein
MENYLIVLFGFSENSDISLLEELKDSIYYTAMD